MFVCVGVMVCGCGGFGVLLFFVVCLVGCFGVCVFVLFVGGSVWVREGLLFWLDWGVWVVWRRPSLAGGMAQIFFRALDYRRPERLPSHRGMHFAIQF